jgi:hypothetical protein
MDLFHGFGFAANMLRTITRQALISFDATPSMVGLW